MRRLPLIERLLRVRGSRGWIRCVLVMEELEGREVLSPIVSPGFVFHDTSENVPYTFSTPNESAFQASDSADAGQTYTALLTATNGTLSVDTGVATSNGLSVSGNGTASVRLTGTLTGINNLLSNGLTATPTAYFSGETRVVVQVTDTVSSSSDSGTSVVKVHPVVSGASLVTNASSEQYAPSSGFAFPPGLVSVTNWPDADGSEVVTLQFSLDAPDPSLFTLSANGSALSPVEDGLWSVTATSQASLQSILDSLVLTPPAGYNGRAYLDIFGDISDTASFPSDDGSSETDPYYGSQFIGGGVISVRYFVGGSVSLPPVLAREGDTIDLGGRYSASDPDEMEGDIHTMTLSVPGGTLQLNAAAVPAGLSASRTVASDGSTTVTLIGSIAGINQFLATQGCLTYTATSLTFSGGVPLTVTLANQPVFFMGGGSDMPSDSGGSFEPPTNGTSAPNAFRGVGSLLIAPVADHVIPSAIDVTTPQDTPVSLSIGVTSLADTDGSETLLVVVGGVPAGASLSAGTDLGSGKWAFTPAELAGLIFTPPSGATDAYALTVTAIVTDSAASIGTDVASDSVTFTIAVTPATIVFIPPSTVDGGNTTIVGFGPGNDQPAENNGVGPGNQPGPAGGDQRSDGAGPAKIAFAGYTGGAGSGPSAAPGVATRGGAQVAAANAPFPQSDSVAPLYAGGERHPLPPVLPLDQSLPVAGFSDSGGDSFALIDMIYRGAGAQPAAAVVTPVSHSIPAELGVAPAPHAKDSEVTAASQSEMASVAAAQPENAGGPLLGDWRLWTAAGAAVIAAFAGARAVGGPNWFAARIARRLLRALHRRPTGRTA